MTKYSLTISLRTLDFGVWTPVFLFCFFFKKVVFTPSSLRESYMYFKNHSGCSGKRHAVKSESKLFLCAEIMTLIFVSLITFSGPGI